MQPISRISANASCGPVQTFIETHDLARVDREKRDILELYRNDIHKFAGAQRTKVAAISSKRTPGAGYSVVRNRVTHYYIARADDGWHMI